MLKLTVSQEADSEISNIIEFTQFDLKLFPNTDTLVVLLAACVAAAAQKTTAITAYGATLTNPLDATSIQTAANAAALAVSTAALAGQLSFPLFFPFQSTLIQASSWISYFIFHFRSCVSALELNLIY